MHLYWRIKEELLYLGEVLVFHDPRFTREYNRWFERRGRDLECGVSPKVSGSIRKTKTLQSTN